MLEKLGEYKKYGHELRFNYCPICKKHKKENPCFTINEKKGFYTCHSTGESGHINQLEGYEDIEFPEKDDEKVEVVADFTEKYLGMEKEDESWEKYLSKRGISKSSYRQLVHFDKKRMAIPISDGKKVIGIKYRTQEKKMSAEPGSQYSHLIHWRSIQNREYLIITEGEIDLLSCLEAGFNNTVSLPGGASNFKSIKNQIEWLREFEKIIIATDNDSAGENAKKEIVKILTGFKTLYFIDFGEFKDFNELLVKNGIEGVKKAIKGAKKIKKKKVNQDLEEFEIREDGYYVFSNGGYTRLTNFTIELEKFSNNYFEGTVFSGRINKKFKCSKSDLFKKQGMLENLGYFLGSDTKITKFLLWLEEENKDLFVDEVQHFGIIENNYYDANSNIVCGKKDLYFKNYNEIEDLTDKEKEWLKNNLLGLRKEVNQSLLGISWAMGRFHCEDAPYPILEVCGTTSIGKTEFIENVSKILFGAQENIKNFSTLTNHQIRSLASCSNITPFSIDEIKMTSRVALDKIADLYSLIRSVYDNKTINQGNTSSKLTEFKLCTPLIISGESELSDVSIKNRMVQIKLTKENKSTFEVFQYFKNTDILYKLGKEALKNRLKNKIKIDLKDSFEKVADDRQRYNLRCILQGFEALEQIITVDLEIKNNFFKFLEGQFSNEMTPQENFVQLLELVIESGIDYSQFYRNENGIHAARFQQLYVAIAEQHKKTNSTLELMDMKGLKKQLIESNYIIAQNTNTKFFSSDGLRTLQAKAVHFRLKIV